MSSIEETYSVLSDGVAAQRLAKIFGQYVLQRIDNKCVDEAIVIYKHETQDFYLLNTTDSWVVFGSDVLLKRPVSPSNMSVPSDGWHFLSESDSGESFMADPSIQVLPKGGRWSLLSFIYFLFVCWYYLVDCQ